MRARTNKITVVVRLTPEDALTVLSYMYRKKMITAKQYINKTEVAVSAMEILFPEAETL